MNWNRTAAVIAVAALAAGLESPRPALANGAASTRNIILGGAAAAAGTLLIINHNKKVHEKYAEYDRRQAYAEQQRNDARSAYENEQQAYGHEAALVSEYRRETAYQHHAIVVRDRQIAALEHSLVIAKYGHAPQRVALRQTAPRVAARPAHGEPIRVAARPASAAGAAESWGWGSY